MDQLRDPADSFYTEQEPTPTLDIRTLRVGDVIYVPCKAPFSTHRRVYRGVENNDVVGIDNPYVITIGYARIFWFQIEGVKPWQPDSDWQLPPWLRDKYVLGDPLFGTEQTLWRREKPEEPGD